ncbi:hypothetical protein V7147_10630 [Bacillus sp. JJ1521]|uniref:hypothetical protein n=1 Tax=Bacillus sp. JJ1521 TaxID=3122957 RepID=UPI002FFE00FD
MNYYLKNSYGLFPNRNYPYYKPQFTPYFNPNSNIPSVVNHVNETPFNYQDQVNPKNSSQNDGQKKPAPSGETKKKDETKKKKKGKEPKITKGMINFEKLQAGSISNASGIFNGKNIQFGWSSHRKENSGFGTLGGHNNKVIKNTNVVFDNDQIDTPIDDRDTMWSPLAANLSK